MRASSLVAGLLALSGCTVAPTGPTVMSLPGTGKSFSQFRVDDADCREYAYYRVGGTTASEAATQSAVTSAAVGTAVGAAAGAAIDGRHGAGVGAGTGLLVGSMAGTAAAEGSAYDVQRRYDEAYLQCMYARGNRIPVWGQLAEGAPAPYGRTVPPPPADFPPPPPRGAPPPPPPDLQLR